MAMPIIPRLIRGRLYFEIGPLLFPTFVQGTSAGAAADAHRLDMAQALELQTQPPLRRCDDCQLHLGRDVLRALGARPRWGMCRAGVEVFAELQAASARGAS